MTHKYMVATDVGGTCTDTIVFAAGEPAHLGKALSTPPDFSVGVIQDTETALPEDPFLEDVVTA